MAEAAVDLARQLAPAFRSGSPGTSPWAGHGKSVPLDLDQRVPKCFVQYAAALAQRENVVVRTELQIQLPPATKNVVAKASRGYRP